MIRLLSLTLAASLFLVATGAPSNQGRTVPASQEIPKFATVEILLNAQGITGAESNWEIAYELRLANDLALWHAWKQKRTGNGKEERVGDLIKEGEIRKTLRSPEDQKLILHIPLGPDVRQRLRNQPRDRLKIPSGEPSPEEIKLLREQEIRTQSFLFDSVINIYDGNLKKKFIVPVSFGWSYDDFPNAKFEIKVEGSRDGSYRVKPSLPKNAAGGQLEIRQ